MNAIPMKLENEREVRAFALTMAVRATVDPAQYPENAPDYKPAPSVDQILTFADAFVQYIKSGKK